MSTSVLAVPMEVALGLRIDRAKALLCLFPGFSQHVKPVQHVVLYVMTYTGNRISGYLLPSLLPYYSIYTRHYWVSSAMVARVTNTTQIRTQATLKDHTLSDVKLRLSLE